MNNYAKLEKSRGVLVFANNTDTIDYIGIANKTIQLAKHHLGIETLVVTQDYQTTYTNARTDIDTEKSVQWNNFGRHRAWEVTPWDETLVIDADYLVTTPRLLTLFDSPSDLVLCHQNNYLYEDPDPKCYLPPVWATVFFFRRTERNKLFFDLVGKIERNWIYYRILFGLPYRNFRNDLAFAMAERIMHGYQLPQHTQMPWAITTIEKPLLDININTDWMVVRTKERADVLPRQDLHVMSKQWLQSEKLDHFIEQAL
jgi:hypothetical protein